jgi:hypothetical protein
MTTNRIFVFHGHLDFNYDTLFLTALCNNVKCCNNSECQNGQCVCKEGYHGDGAKKCEGDTNFFKFIIDFLNDICMCESKGINHVKRGFSQKHLQL